MKTPTTRNKERLDAALVGRGLVDSRQKARAVILAGAVLVEGMRVDKAGAMINHDAEITVTSSPCPYVGRGGMKLEAALVSFAVDVSGLVILDVGASTGGFTDCLLKAGAGSVYALDVGYGQFDWGLRTDERVTVMERTNIRYAKKDDFTREIDGAVIDVSFISLSLVLPAVYEIVRAGGFVVALVKPQFEVGKGDVGKGGVVKDPEKHRQAVERIAHAARETGFTVAGSIQSPLIGPKGNKEFFIYMKKE
jgi:23S rRNA (cytidine1920-2'-O)/16S rRNA (cytidine1409-2'-O)-methyltransferase